MRPSHKVCLKTDTDQSFSGRSNTVSQGRLARTLRASLQASILDPSGGLLYMRTVSGLDLPWDIIPSRGYHKLERLITGRGSSQHLDVTKPVLLQGCKTLHGGYSCTNTLPQRNARHGKPPKTEFCQVS